MIYSSVLKFVTFKNRFLGNLVYRTKHKHLSHTQVVKCEYHTISNRSISKAVSLKRKVGTYQTIPRKNGLMHPILPGVGRIETSKR